MRALALALLLLLLSSPAGAVYPNRPGCDSALDYGSNAWVTYPDLIACTASSKTCGAGGPYDTLLWTSDRIASAGRVVVNIGSGETTLGFPGEILIGGEPKPDFTPYANDAFGLFFEDGRTVERVPDLQRFLAEIESRPGGDKPIKTHAMRFDLAFREQVSRIGDLTPEASMFLRSDRPLANLAASFAGGVIADSDVARCGASGTDCDFSTCRNPDSSVKVADELYGAAGTTNGCGRTYDGTSNKERGARLPELLEGISAGLGEGASYYLARPNSDAKVFYPYAVNTDMLDPAWQALTVKWAQQAIALGYDAVDFPHKDHFFMDGEGGFTVPQRWPDTADALGGYTGLSAAIAADGIGISGPWERANGDAWNYARRKKGEVEIARLLDTAGVPTVRIVNPYWFQNCPTSIGDWDTSYDDAACTGSDTKYDDPASGSDEEDAYQREIVARADYILIQIGGKTLDAGSGGTGGIGSGGGSGWGYANLKALIESMASPDGTPPVVLGYSDGTPFAEQRGIPPKFCANTSEDNPESDLEVCGDGDRSAGEECDDGNTTGGDGCDQWCRKPDVFVIAGQSNAVGYSTQGADVRADPRVTSPDPITGLISSNYRYRYTDPGESAGGLPLAILNDFPCDASQCTGTACSGQNLTLAGHPDSTAATSCSGGTCTNGVCVGGSNPGVDCDGTCQCYCGVHGSAFGSWEGGSPWPTFAKHYMHGTGREVMLIDVTMPGQALIYDGDGAGPSPLFYPYTDCTTLDSDYNNERGDLSCGIFRAADLAGFEGEVKAVLWQQGEAEVTGGTSSAAYQTALEDLSNKIDSMYGRTVPLIVSTISTRTDTGDACTDGSGGFARIKTGQENAINSDPNIYRGPNLDDMTFAVDIFGGSDCIHYYDQQMQGERWYEAVRHMLTGQAYDGGAVVVPPASTVVAEFLASPVQGATCVAPCVVHLDALSTTSTETSRPFHEIDYRWDGDNPGAGTYVGTGFDKNKPRGPVTGIPYDDPGTYTIELTARDTSDTDQKTHDVVVVAPLATYGSRLFCFRDAADGNFAGCPLDTNADGTCDTHAGNCQTESDAAAALNTIANVDTGGSKGGVYFRKGDTFTGLGTFTSVTGSGPATMGAFGSGARPIITGVQDFVMNPGWTYHGIELIAANPDNANFFSYGAGKANITVYDMVARDGANCGGTSNGSSTHNNLLAYVDSECYVDPDGTWSSGGGGSHLFIRADRFLLLGNIIDGGRTREFNLRTTHAYKAAIQYNWLRNPDEGRNNIQIRSWACGGSATSIDACGVTEPFASADQYVVISDNKLTAPTNSVSSTVIRITQDNAAGNSGWGDPQGSYDHLIERNFFQFELDATIGSMATGFVWAEAGRITIRNNIMDLRGPMTTGTITRFFQQSPNILGCEDCVNDDNTIQGNVIFYDQDYNQDLDFCSSTTGSTGNLCQGNLAYRPNDGVVGTPDTGSASGDDWVIGPGWTQSGNLRTGTNPFVATIPAHASTVAADFVLSASSAAKDLATPTLPWISDYCLAPRPFGASNDAGAWEYGATCP